LKIRLPKYFDPVVLCSLLSGFLAALAFPRPSLTALAWVGLIPVLLVMQKRPFLSGFLAGFAFFGTVLYWLNIVMTTYGHMAPFFSVAAYLILVCYLALFFGTSTWLTCRVQEKLGWSPIWVLPIAWVGLEFLRSFLLSGFPWATLGYALQPHPMLIQSADLAGVYGLSFLLVLTNIVLAETVRVRFGRKGPVPRLGLIVLSLFLLGNCSYGWWRLQQPLEVRDQVMTTVLGQGNIDQGVKWNPAYQTKTIEIYRRLSLQGAQEGPTDLLIWPESATPFYFQDGGPLAALVRETAVESASYLLFGSPAYEVVNRQVRYLNSAFLLSKQGKVLGRSDKVHLVPFGEYVPLATFLPFIDKLVAGIGDFSPGVVAPLPANGARLGVLVCFEGIFPELARSFVREGSDVLINITNDAWFGRSSAPYQHLAMTCFRAVENRVWVARAANTGISAFIAPTGEVKAATAIFEERFLRGQIGVGAVPTLYTRFGDVGPTLCLIISVVWLVQTRRRFRSS